MNAPLKTTADAATDFVRRHIGPSPRDIDAMLDSVGASSLAELMSQTLPGSIRQKKPLDLGPALSETEALAHMRDLAAQNQVFTSLIGTGYSGTILPAVIQRNILENPAWYTAYTPYQPEISQGTLHALFEFQTQVAMLTGMEVANASMYDGSTATAEAVLMARRVTRRGKAVLAGGLHPHYRETVETVSRMSGGTLDILPPDPTGSEDILARIDADTACVVVQSPSFYGHLIDLRPLAEKCHAAGALLVAAFTEVVALRAVL